MPYYIVPVVETGGMMTHGPVPVPMRAPLGYQDAPNKFICLGDIALISTTAPLSDPRAIKLADGKDERPAVATRLALANHVTDGRRFDRVTDKFNGSILELLKTPPPKAQWRTFPLNQDPGVKRAPGFYVHLDPDDVDGSLPFAFEAGPKLHASKGWLVPMNGGPRQFFETTADRVYANFEPKSPYEDNFVTYISAGANRVWRSNGRIYADLAVPGSGAFGCEPWSIVSGSRWTHDSANIELFTHWAAYSTVGTSGDRQMYFKCFIEPDNAHEGYAFFLKADAGSSSVGAFIWSDTGLSLATSYVGGVTMPGEWYAIYTGSAWSIYRNGVLMTGPSTDTTVDTSARACWLRWDAQQGSDSGYGELTKIQLNDVGYTFPDLTPVVHTFPSTAILDDFNRADGAIGSDWNVTFGSGGIVSNAIEASGSDYVIEWALATFGLDCEVRCEVRTVGSLALFLQFYVAGGQYYRLDYDDTLKTIAVSIGGVTVGYENTQLGDVIPYTLANDDGIGFCRRGTRLEVWVRRGLTGAWRPVGVRHCDIRNSVDSVGVYLFSGTVVNYVGGGTVVPITELQEAEAVEGNRLLQLHATDNAFLPEKD